MKRIILTVATLAALTTGAVVLGSGHAAATAAPPVNETIVPAPPPRIHVAPPVVVAAPAPAPVPSTPAPPPITAPPAPTPSVATPPIVTPAPTPAPDPAPVTLPSQPQPAPGVPTEVEDCFVSWTGPQIDASTGKPVVGAYGGTCDVAYGEAALHPGAVVTVVTSPMNAAS